MSRRLLSLLVVSAVLVTPGVVLGAACVGKSCASSAAPAARVPFCPLPAELKSLIADGYYEGRSPDVFAVPDSAVAGGSGPADDGVPWPQASPLPDTRVPIALFGAGIREGSLPSGTSLDQIAPTLADVIGFKRPHPNIRAGKALPGLVKQAEPRLIVEIAWTGVGTSTLKANPSSWPFLRSQLSAGSTTLEGTTGSVPLDPAATLTTYGTGALPYQHGITGSVIRDKTGGVGSAWSPKAPISVLATFADDYHQAHPSAKIGLVEPLPVDRGLIGGNWYIGEKGASIVHAPRHPGGEVLALLARKGFGRDATTDILGVVLRGSVQHMDTETGSIVDAIHMVIGSDVTFSVAGTGALETSGASDPQGIVQRLEASIPGASSLIAGVEPGGFFIDQDALTRLGVSSGVAVQTLDSMKAPDGSPEFADSFQGFSIAFRRYCP